MARKIAIYSEPSSSDSRRRVADASCKLTLTQYKNGGTSQAEHCESKEKSPGKCLNNGIFIVENEEMQIVASWNSRILRGHCKRAKNPLCKLKFTDFLYVLDLI